jgi:hypothetical protein
MTNKEIFFIISLFKILVQNQQFHLIMRAESFKFKDRLASLDNIA